MARAPFCIGLVVTALATSWLARPAWADDKAACLDANGQAQTLRDARRLVDAREQLRICARAECPRVVRSDCVTWLAEVEKALPTVVLSAKDATGKDVREATVTVDGKALATRLDGQALAVDPGPHTFRFERADGAAATQQVVIRDGEKARAVSVVLAAGAPVAPVPVPVPASPEPVPMPTPAPQDAGSRPSSSLRLVGWIVGGAGVVAVGVGGGIALAAKSKDQTAAGEPGLARQTDSQAAVQQGNVATLVMGLGAAAVATGVVLWIVSPGSSTRVGTNGHELLLGGAF